MYGLLAVFGPAAKDVSRDRILSTARSIAPADAEFYSDGKWVSVALFSPPERPGSAPFEWTRDGRLGCALDGYVVTNTLGSLALQRRELLRLIHAEGVEIALRKIVAGAFTFALLDLDRELFAVANDRVGSIPVYYGTVPDGCIVATAPSLPGALGLTSREPDLTAVAELVFIGHTVGDRYFSKGLRRLPPASILRWDNRRRELSVSATGLDPAHLGPADRTPDVDEIAELVRASCRRVAGLGGEHALLLSGGMDSRLILAAWPREEKLPCYSYGPSEFADVTFARAAAAVRGSTFTRVPLDGDEVAAAVDEMLRLSGPPTFPPRYLTGRVLAADGLDTALDGYAGDVLLGGSYYGFARFLSRPARWAQLVNRLGDRRVGDVGLDALAEGLFESLWDAGATDWLDRYAEPEVARMLVAQKPAILQDIRNTLGEMAPPDGSVAVAVRDFKLMQRAMRTSLHQGVLCRRFVRIEYPLFCDAPLLEATWRLAPKYTAFRRLYIRLFRRHFPEYAGVPYAASLLPLKRSALLHRAATTIRSRGVPVPWTGSARPKYDEWATWLRESSALRERSIALLSQLGLAEAPRLRAMLNRIASGQDKGAGDLLHVGGLAQLVKPLTSR